MSQRQQIKRRVDAPEALDEVGREVWRDVVLALLRKDAFYKDLLPKIWKLCEIESRREELIEQIGIREKRAPFRDARFVDLANPEKFDERFEKYLPLANTKKQAFEWVEREFSETFGRNKYSGYRSFLKCYNRRKVDIVPA